MGYVSRMMLDLAEGVLAEFCEHGDESRRAWADGKIVYCTLFAEKPAMAKYVAPRRVPMAKLPWRNEMTVQANIRRNKQRQLHRASRAKT
jgi:hypothetical protein